MNTSPKNTSLLIIGATGGSGKQITRQALERGYTVQVLVRTPEKLGDLKDFVTIYQGDATNENDVLAAVANADVVISAIGPTKDSKLGMQPAATKAIVEAMKHHSKKRLITLTGAGVRHVGDLPKLADKLIRGIMKVVAKKALSDGEGHAEIVKKSGLDWTVVRGPMLTDDPARGRYVTGKVGEPQMTTKISRADLATAVLDMIFDTATYHTMPMVSWPK